MREGDLDGLAPGYALRIEATGEDLGRPLTGGDEAPVQSDSLFTPDGPVDDSR